MSGATARTFGKCGIILADIEAARSVYFRKDFFDSPAVSPPSPLAPTRETSFGRGQRLLAADDQMIQTIGVLATRQANRQRIH
jgi:hypothetical protein